MKFDIPMYFEGWLAAEPTAAVGPAGGWAYHRQQLPLSLHINKHAPKIDCKFYVGITLQLDEVASSDLYSRLVVGAQFLR